MCLSEEPTERILGFTKDEWLAQPGFWGEHLFQEDKEQFTNSTRRAAETRGSQSFEHRMVAADGRVIWFRDFVHGVYGPDGREERLRGVMLDITESRNASGELRKVNRALRAISECDDALVRATEEAELLGEVCRIMVETGGYRFAWVGFLQPDADETVLPMAYAGHEEAYLDKVEIMTKRPERSRDPAGTAIRTGKPCVVRDVAAGASSSTSPWREEALVRGYASAIALPLAAEGKTFGAMGIYSQEKDAFDQEEVDLLLGLADNLAFGVVSLRARKAKLQAEEALREANDKLKALIESSPVAIQALDSEGKVMLWNSAAERFSAGPKRRRLDVPILSCR